MNEAIEQIRSLLTKADQALTRQADTTRTARQRDDDFDEALRAHRQAAAILGTLHAKPDVDEAFVAALAPLQVEAGDLEILISEIRFDEAERTERLPRLRHIG
jgi:hypothetical protein